MRNEYQQTGHLCKTVLLDGLVDVEPAIDDEERSEPLSVRRLAWRLSWTGEKSVNSTTVVASALHLHSLPEND